MPDAGGSVVALVGGPWDGQSLRRDRGNGQTRVYRWVADENLYLLDDAKDSHSGRADDDA